MDKLRGCPFTSFINPEPITVKAIKTFNLPLFYIFAGKNGRPPEFVPVEEKTEGCALGDIFKKATQIETDKQWLGKVGDPRGIFKDNEDSIRTRTRKELNIDTIFEKLAYDLYQELGRGYFIIPKTRLSPQRVLNSFNENHFMANHWEARGITETLRIMSSYIVGYTDLGKALTEEGGNKVSFVKYLTKHHRPPTHILTPEGKSVRLHGLMALLAVGRCLADIDLLGGAALNAGFVWIRQEGEIIGAQAVKIDPGYAFRFTHHDPKQPSGNCVIDTHRKLGNSAYFLKDLRDIQTSTGNYKTIISWKALKREQKNEFISALLNCARYIQSEAVLDLLFYREGKFFHSEAAHMPVEEAKRMQNAMKEWIQWQLKIYSASLSYFQKVYPEQLLRIKYIDAFGKLPLPMSKETYPIRELFTNLMLIKQNETVAKKNLVPASEEKVAFDLELLFEGGAKKVLLFGNFGSGKSTLCQKMAHDWAAGKLFSQFEGVFWVPLRHLNQLAYTEASPEEFFAKAVAHHFFNDPLLGPLLFKKIKSNHSQILFILDGFDEAYPELQKRVQVLFNDPDLHLIVSSRPGFRDLMNADRVIESIGFSDQHIESYVKCFFSRENKSEQAVPFLQALRKDSFLLQLAHTPLQLQMLCTIWEKSLGKNVIASTLTDLYETMVTQILAWQSSYLSKDLTKVRNELAFFAANELFDRKIVNNNFNFEALLETGLIKAEGNGYYFLHLTFQEYLAADYFSNLSPAGVSDFLQMFQKHTENKVLITFLCGIIYKKHPETISSFFDALKVSKDNLELAFSCLNECKNYLGSIPVIEHLLNDSEIIHKKLAIPEKLWLDKVKALELALYLAAQDQMHALKWLLHKKPELLHRKDEDGRTLFTRACLNGNIELMEFLYNQPEGRYLIHVCFYDGFTSFHATAYGGNILAMEWVYSKDPMIIEKHCEDGYTPFHSVARSGSIEAMEWLYRKDPSLIKKYRSNGWTPFHSAARSGSIKVMEWLYSKDPSLIKKYTSNGWTPLHSAARSGSIKVMEWLYSKDPSLIKKYTSNGWTPLHSAAEGGSVEAIKYLHSLDPTLIYKYRKDGWTPLHSAAEGGSVEATKYLCNLDPGLIYEDDKNGWIPLHIAADKGYIEAIKYLCSLDRQLIYEGDIDGWTPFHCIAKRGNLKVMEWLFSEYPNLKYRLDGSTPLHSAARSGNVLSIQWVLKENPKLIEDYSYNQLTPLHAAAEGGNVEAIKYLHSLDPTLIYKGDEDGWTPLHTAAEGGQVEAIKCLCSLDRQLIYKGDKNGRTPLHAAAQGGSVEAIKYLCSLDCHLIYEGDRNGWFPLHVATDEGHIEAIKYLCSLDLGLIYEGDKDGWTPFHCIAKRGNLKAMEWLFSKYPSLKYRLVGSTPFHMAARSGSVSSIQWLLKEDPRLIEDDSYNQRTPLHSAAEGGSVEAIRYLRSLDPKLIHKCDRNEETPLHSAAIRGQVEAIKYLHSLDPQLIYKCDVQGRTPLDAAAHEGQLEASKYLHSLDPKLIYKGNERSRTLFHFAAEGGHLDVIKYVHSLDPQLIYKGDKDGLTPLHATAKRGSVETIQYLCSLDRQLIYKWHKDGWTPLHFAAKGGNVEAIKYLHSLDSLLIYKGNKDGWTPLHTAAKRGDVEAIKCICSLGPQLINKYSKDGWTPLHFAAVRGQVEAIKYLHSLDPQLIYKYNKDGRTPLHSAAEGGEVDAIECLHGLDPQLIYKYNKDGWTPLHSAAEGGDVKAIKYLHSLDPQLIYKYDKNGWTPLHSAAEGGHVEAIECLHSLDPQLIYKCDKEGWTPLHSAADGGDVKAIKYLHSLHPQIIYKYDKNGWTPLHVAAERGHVDAIECLHSLDPQLIYKCDKDGWIPLHFAAQKGRIKVMKWIIMQDSKLLQRLTLEDESACDIAKRFKQKKAEDWLRQTMNLEPGVIDFGTVKVKVGLTPEEGGFTPEFKFKINRTLDTEGLRQ